MKKYLINKYLLIAFCCVLIASLSACAPKIYVVDRHTIMEEEAAGEWPEFEKDLMDKSTAQGPAFLSKTDSSTKRKRLLNVLNGEMVSK